MYINLLTEYAVTLSALKEEGNLRMVPDNADDGCIYDLCSNDYMGLAQRAGEFMGDFKQMPGSDLMTSSASRLLSLRQDAYSQFEQWLSTRYGRPSLLFNSGYHCNVGIVTALNRPGTLWAVDRQIHASVIDGLKMSGAEFVRWRHNDLTHLEEILQKKATQYKRVFVVAEGIYSMDGDRTPLSQLAALRDKYDNVALYLDEAHSLGTLGPTGLGLAEETGLIDSVDILVGTLGKAVASAGAFVICDKTIRDYLVNKSRSLIFSTAMPPANVAWSMLMMQQLTTMAGTRSHLAHITKIFREGVEGITGVANPSQSAIVPLITGDVSRAIRLACALRQRGIHCLPIRRPTVAPGGERIRFSLNANLSEADINKILLAVKEEYDRCN